ncbi:restriction endonuclease [Velocimicrobium porci]|uniref:Restriction endonuclease n=1 Tax=Velocimicrobium porci TaxID=2606634 RepID=A0A6L5XVH3_9FIRM|nr:restriction endonuclease [Velocimicrobium porci]MSS62840.1 restriction endonuclease [Velocimicrobium porci]
MLNYIKKLSYFFIESIVLFLVILSFLLLKTTLSINQNWIIVLLIISFCLVLIIKIQIKKWNRFRILHFSIKKVDKMTGIEFENFLLTYFKSLGCEAQTTKASNDYGADLILEYKKRKISVQAKRYQGTIGVKAVQEVIGSMAYYNTDCGLVVTNSYYSKNAEELAFANNVILWDRDVLIQMMNHENMTGYLSEFL